MKPLMNQKITVRRLNLCVTKYCNLHCRMCDFTQHYVGKDEMSLEILRSTVKEFAALGGTDLEITGGEPMTREGIYEIIADAHSYGLKTLMISNGVLIGPKEAKKLLETGLSAVSFSLEGPEPLNDSLRGPGSFQKTMGAIRSFFSERPDFEISIGITLSKYNYKSILSFSKFLLEEIGVHKISINPFEKWMLKGENRETRPVEFEIPEELIPDLTIELERLMEYGKTMPERLPSPGYLNKIPGYFLGQRFIPPNGCNIPSTFCGVDPIGRVFPCWKTRLPVGDLKTMSLTESLQSESYRDLCEISLAGQCYGCLTSCYSDIC